MGKNNHAGTPENKGTGHRKKGWWGRYLERLAKFGPPKPAQMGSGCKH